ncbi:MAG: hypothetical protein JSW68_10200 [Burkholderiales bacterium]|nr:MAG: hypothetical protein JSW68_10200 [Burkholderiales bacterium]
MSAAALALVVTAAFLHATWNLLAKRAQGGVSFVWLYSLATSVIYLPVVLGYVWWFAPRLVPMHFVAMVISGALHSAYATVLQRGYRVGDLSVVYPVARGTGPLLTIVGAVLLFGERPALIAVGGALCVIGGVFWLAGGLALLDPARRSKGVVWGLATGVCIAGYTLWDANVVTTMALAPLLLDYGNNVSRALLLTPIALGRRDQTRDAWRQGSRAVLGVATLAPLSYIMVLTAVQFTPVSYVAPAREASMLIAAVLGARLLGEGRLAQRVGAAALIVLGVVGIALG